MVSQPHVAKHADISLERRRRLPLAVVSKDLAMRAPVAFGTACSMHQAEHRPTETILSHFTLGASCSQKSAGETRPARTQSSCELNLPVFLWYP